MTRFLNARDDQFAHALIGDHRHPDIEAAEDIYAPLLGAWAVEARDYLDDGTQLVGNGEWFFARVLNGRGVQDVWILPSRSAPKSARHPCERYGTSIRTFDPHLRRWRVVWLNPISGAFDQLWARSDNGAIVQEGSSADGQQINWTFATITETSFHWIAKARYPSGEWRTEAEFFGSRLL